MRAVEVGGGKVRRGNEGGYAGDGRSAVAMRAGGGPQGGTWRARWARAVIKHDGARLLRMTNTVSTKESEHATAADAAAAGTAADAAAADATAASTGAADATAADTAADTGADTTTPATSPTDSIRASAEPLEIADLGVVDYVDTWHKQAEAAAARAAGEIGDQLWALEHPSTYTAGKRTQPEDRPDNGLPVVDVDRGGRITWHGPGQLVCYPIIKLAEPLDVVDYVRRIEEAVIHVVRDLGLADAGRVEGRSGVWLPAGVVGGQLKPSRKVAAIGIRVTHGVTMHGVSLNCDNTLDHYGHIVPCGIADAGVTTLSEELGRDVTVADLREPLTSTIAAALDGTLRVEKHDL